MFETNSQNIQKVTKENAIKIFEQKQVRTHWDDESEKWFFAIVDVLEVLSDSYDPQSYWRKLKQRLKAEGNETVTKIHGLKMIAKDGKMRLTDVADTEQLFRLIQSVPSKKAEPFKLWLSKVGQERIDEIEDPEIGIERLMETYLKKGYSKEWINQRLKSIEVRKELTDEWEARGVEKGQEYAILTDEITKAWSGFSVKQYKNHKGLKKENLRDNMTEISKQKNPKNFQENKIIAKQGGTIAGNTRKEIEEKTGKKIVSSLNARVPLKEGKTVKKINKKK